MNCPVCGATTEKMERARHLPRFLRCPDCGGFFAGEKAETAYPEGYFSEGPERLKKGIFSPLLDFFLWLRMRKIARLLPGTEGKILDYGCGNGGLVAYLRKRGFDAEGFDPSPAAVALARKDGLPVFQNVPEKQYNLIMFWHSLEHIRAPLEAVQQVVGRLAPVGKMLIAVPNGESFEAALFSESWFCYDWPFHVVQFTPRSLSILLEKAGMRVRSVDYLNPEYTISSLAQTALNLFLPKNAFYSFVSRRRQTLGKGSLLLLGIFSLLLLVVLSPVLVLFFTAALILGRSAAFIMSAERIV